MISALELFAVCCVAGILYGLSFDWRRWRNERRGAASSLDLDEIERQLAEISEALDRVELELSLFPQLEEIRDLPCTRDKGWRP